MGIDAVELRRLTLPMVSPFKSGAVDLHERDLLLVRAVVDGVDGWGECAALPSAGYTAITTKLAIDLLKGARNALLRGDELGAPGLGGAIAVGVAPWRDAVLDARLRAEDRSLTSWLGGTRATVPAGVAVGLHDDTGELVDDIARQLEAGYRRVKLKIAPGNDVRSVAIVREHFGETLALQVDANAAYTLDDAATLAALDDFDLLLIEQPLAADDLEGHAELAALLATPVCLDESIHSLDNLDRALAMGACDVACIKPGLLGGIEAAHTAHDRCMIAGVDAWLGGMLETGIGRAALLALGALPGFALAGDISATGRWYVDDLTPTVELVDGELTVPTGPGLGVTPDLASLARYTTWTETFRADAP
jgi:O-succinylbenzoate synthase